MRLDWSFLDRPLTKREQKLILIFIISIILCSIYFILTPRIIELNDLKNQLDTILKERSVYKRMDENLMDHEELLTKYDNIIKIVPQNKEISEFLTDIEKWANENNIAITSIYPQSTMIEDVEEVTINVIPFEIKISGRYDSLLNFMSELENYSRISRIYGMELKTSNDKVVNSSLPWELVVKVRLYYLP